MQATGPADHFSPAGLTRTRVLTTALLAAFIAMIAVLITSSIVGTLNTQSVYGTSDAVAHTYSVKAALQQLLATLVDAETGERGFIITGANYLEPYERALGAIPPALARVRTLTADNPDQQADLDRLSSLTQVKLDQLAEAIRQRRESGPAAAQAVVATNMGRHTMDDMRVIVSRMGGREDALLAVRTARAARSYRLAFIAGYVTTGLALVVVVALFAGTWRAGKDRLRAIETAERLRVTLASIGDAMIATDGSGRVTYMNHVAESLTGWKQEEAAGRILQEVFAIVNEQTRQPAENPALRAIREGRIVGLANHTVLIARNGTEIPIDDSGSPIRGPDGTVLGAVLIFRDITERRRAEKERERLAEQSRMLDSGFDAIIVRDSHDRVTSWNRVAEILYGWTADAAQGRVTHELFKTCFPKPLDEINQDLHRDNRWEGELVHTRKDGSPVTVLSHWILDGDSEGLSRSVLEINIDISGRKRAEEALRRQREWLRVTLASIGDAVIATDTTGAVTFLNHVAESLTGWIEKDALARPLQEVFQIVNEQTRQPVENPALRAMHLGLIVGLANHTVLLGKDGIERPIDDAGSPIRDEDGKTIGAVLIFRDITERKRAEERFRQNQQTFVELVERAPFGLYIVDSQFRIAHMNAGSQSGAFRNVRPVIGRDFAEAMRILWPEPVAADIIAVFRHTLETGEPYYSPRFTNPRHDVQAVESYEWELHRMTLPDGQFGVICYYFDSTRIRESEQREQLLRQLAEEANRVKDEFLAMLSHELRNPLSSILGWARILRTGQTPPERADHALEVIERNARVEAQLVDSLLDLSRIAAGKLQLDSERVELPILVETVVDSVRPAADSKGITLQITPTAEQVIVIGDSGRMQQIFSNLLTNAIKFTRNGGRIQVRVTRRGSQAQIQVIDNGEGIDAEFLPRIFDRFRQAETGKGRPHGGLGLGLAIVRELVHAHGGTILAESPGKGKGSTFTVTLPIPAVIPAHIEAPGSRPPHTEEHSIAGLRILVVDDEADARELVGLTLQSREAVIQLASSASEALRSISRERPDVMIADIGMPDADGYVLIQTLRAMERDHSHKRLPAIALTAYATAADRRQALAAGYDLHLAKPVGPSELTQALSRFRKTREREA